MILRHISVNLAQTCRNAGSGNNCNLMAATLRAIYAVTFSRLSAKVHQLLEKYRRLFVAIKFCENII